MSLGMGATSAYIKKVKDYVNRKSNKSELIANDKLWLQTAESVDRIE